MLPKQAIEEYKKLYKERFGVDLDDGEAILRANNLVNLYKAVYEPFQGNILKEEGDEN